jgi:hypothetical protein
MCDRRLPDRCPNPEAWQDSVACCRLPVAAIGSGLGQVAAPLWVALDAEPRAQRARRFGDAVQPGALAASARYKQVPVADLEPQS